MLLKEVERTSRSAGRWCSRPHDTADNDVDRKGQLLKDEIAKLSTSDPLVGPRRNCR
jgi:hypothetical protein